MVVRKVNKQWVQQFGAIICREFAIQAVGVVHGDPVIDDLDLDEVVVVVIVQGEGRLGTEDEASGVLRGDGAVVTEEQGGNGSQYLEHSPDTINCTEENDDNDGYVDM